MAGTGAGRGGHDACLFCRVGAAPNIAAIDGPRGYPDPRAFGEGGGLYGRWLRPDCRAAGGLHGAGGRRRQSGLRTARPLPGAQPGGCADRPQAAFVSASQCVPGDSPRAALRRGDEILDHGRPNLRIAAALAPCLARCLGGDASPDPSRFFRASGGRDRARSDRRTTGYRPRGTAYPGASPRSRYRRHRARRRGSECGSPHRHCRRRRLPPRRRGRRFSHWPRRCRRRSPRLLAPAA